MAPWDPLPGAVAASHRPDRLFRSGRPQERPSLADMGQGPGLRKRAGRGPDAPETVRFPSPAIPARLINSDGFDKADGRVVQQLLTVVGICPGIGDLAGY